MRTEAEIAFQRSKIYRLLSYCFFYPDEGLAEFFRSGEFSSEMESALKVLGKTTTFYGESVTAPLRVVKALKGPDAGSMTEEYVACLTLKSGCPPYENDYRRSSVSVYSSDEMADIAGFYRAFGMDFAGDRPDHIAAELEFMHLATFREALAASLQDTDKLDLCLSVEKKFLEDHIGGWVDLFSERLISEGSRIYGPFGLLASSWIRAECMCLGLSPRRAEGSQGPDIEEENQLCPGEAV